MGTFPASNGYTHILVVVDYVTKWVEAIPTSSADHNTSIKMLKEVIFSRFGVPRYLMTDGGSHFIHGAFRKMLAKYDVNHRIASPYHPQSNGQVELSNRELKLILQKTVIDLERIGPRNLMMHYGPIELHIKILWVCLRIIWFMEKHVTYLLNLNIRHIGPLKSSIMISNLPVRRGYLKLAHLMNGEPKPTRMPSCLKKKLKDGMTKGYKSESLM